MTLKRLILKCESEIEYLEVEKEKLLKQKAEIQSEIWKCGNSAERAAKMKQILENTNSANEIYSHIVSKKMILEYLKEGDEL